MGPVQVVVVGFEQPKFTGEVLAEFTRLREAGIVRLIDLLVVTRADDGTLFSIEPPPADGAAFGVLAAAILGETEPGTEIDVAVTGGNGDAVPAWSLAEVVPVGATAAIALIEHVWAQPLKAAIHRAGGTPLEETWLAPQELDALEMLITAAPSGRRD